MATTDPNKVKPSRVETILMAMLGESVEIDEPKSRVEELLLQLKEAIEQGGGSGFTPTQEQLDAMNSGIDGIKVAQIEANKNNISNGNIGIDTPHSNNTATTGNVELIIGQAVDSTTGIITSSNNQKRATHKELFTASAAECADNDFVIAVYCYDIVTGEYIGRIIEDGSVSKSGTIKYANSFSLSSLYKYRLQVKRVDNGDFTRNDINNSISITINSDTVSAIIRNNMYAVIGSPAVYIPTAITGENINNLTVSDIYNDYDALVTANSNVFMRDANIGIDSDNNPIRAYTYMYTPLLRTTENSISADACDSIWSQDIDTKHILICSGVHGDEKTSVLGVLNLITELLTSTDDWAMFLKSNFVIHIVPILNPWGFNNMSRVNKDGVNINRDYGTFATSEARAMRDYIARYGHNIKAIIDSHNTNSDGVYIGTNPNFRKHKMYCRLTVNTAATLKSYLASVYSPSKFPYMWAWQTTNTGTLNDYCNNTVGVSSITLETPRNYAGGSDNNSEVTPLVKAVIANVVQYMGLIS